MRKSLKKKMLLGLMFVLMFNSIICHAKVTKLFWLSNDTYVTNEHKDGWALYYYGTEPGYVDGNTGFSVDNTYME